jgi:glucose-1-phosphate adenylyltransferase
MDMLGSNPLINLNDESWRIFSRHENEAPQYVGAEANVVNSSITEGCEIYGEVVNSVLGAGVKVAKGAVVRDSVIMSGVTVGENAKIEYSIIDSNVAVGAEASVGLPKDKASGITVIGMGVKVPDGKVIGDNEMISNI